VKARVDYGTGHGSLFLNVAETWLRMAVILRSHCTLQRQSPFSQNENAAPETRTALSAGRLLSKAAV
jgi:hypothetical protein